MHAVDCQVYHTRVIDYMYSRFLPASSMISSSYLSSLPDKDNFMIMFPHQKRVQHL